MTHVKVAHHSAKRDGGPVLSANELRLASHSTRGSLNGQPPDELKAVNHGFDQVATIVPKLD